MLTRTAVVAVAALVAIGGGAAAYGQGAITPEQLNWLKANGVPLKTVEAGNGFEDLARLKEMIGDARIVGLGEGTHGTREHFKAKHRLIEFLVEEMGFGIFSIEANMPEAYALNDYVLGGEGDVNRLIGGMYFWTWNTEEVRDMVEWMRAWNAKQKAAGSERRVQFTGFDMQTETVAEKIALDFLEKHDAEFLKEITPRLEELKTYNPYGTGGGNGFGCATGKFPVAEARGKKVKFTGWIKSENLKDGWAGLWWRVDGPTMRFDNMQDRGPRGTSDWAEYSIELDVPEDAQAIYFGLVMPGYGKAWFDGLKIELDGQAWSSEAFDLDFEGGAMKGILPASPSGGAGSPGYRGALDPDVAKTGKQSFRLEGVESKGMTAAQATKITYALLTHMQESRDQYIAATDAKTADWAIQNARVVDQWAGLGRKSAGYAHRDTCMAANVGWIAEQNPRAKIVLWAHNGHMQHKSIAMGSHLAQQFGSDYVNVGFCSSHGEYWAVRQEGKGMGVCTLEQPVQDSFESILESSGEPILLVDLRTAKEDDAGSAWLTEERPFGGMIGALEMPEHYFPNRIRESFDLLLYVRDTTAARQLAARPAKKEEK